MSSRDPLTPATPPSLPVKALGLCVVDFVPVRNSGQGEELVPRGHRHVGTEDMRDIWIRARASCSARAHSRRFFEDLMYASGNQDITDLRLCFT